MSQFISLQSKERIRITLLVLGLIALVLGSFWLLKLMQSPSDGDTSLTPGKPDYFIHDFRYFKMNPDGSLHYDITGVTTVHDPKTDHIDITTPLMTVFDKKQGTATLNAKRGVISDRHTQIHLYDDVNFDRPATETTEHLHVSSPYILVLPNEDLVKTDQQVRIQLGNSVINSVGMIANTKTHDLTLLHSVRGQVESQPKRAQ